MIDALDRIPTVFDDTRATAVLTTMTEAPNLVAEVGRLRSLSFAAAAETTGNLRS
jgi:hypothetical protein